MNVRLLQRHLGASEARFYSVYLGGAGKVGERDAAAALNAGAYGLRHVFHRVAENP